MKPAALLAEPLSQPGGDDGGGLRVKLTNLMTAVVVLSMAQVSIAPFSLTLWRVKRRRFNRPGAAVEAADEVIIGREVSTAA